MSNYIVKSRSAEIPERNGCNGT